MSHCVYHVWLYAYRCLLSKVSGQKDQVTVAPIINYSGDQIKKNESGVWGVGHVACMGDQKGS